MVMQGLLYNEFSTLSDGRMGRIIGIDESCEAEFLGDLCQSIREKSSRNGINLDDNVVAMPTRLSGGQREYGVVTRRGKTGNIIAVGGLVYEIAITLAVLPLKLVKKAGADIANRLLVKTRGMIRAESKRSNMASHVLIIDHEVKIVKNPKVQSKTGSGYFSLYESWEAVENKECRRLYLARDFSKLGYERVNSLPGSCREFWQLYRYACSKFYRVMLFALSDATLKRQERLLLAKAAIYYMGFKYLESKMIESKVRAFCNAEGGIRYVVTTVEGHAYERMISRWTRESGRIHIGYVNTPFVRYQHAILRSDLESMPNILVMNSAIDHMRVTSYLTRLDREGSKSIRVVRRDDGYPGFNEVRELMLGKLNKRHRIKALVVPSGTIKEVKTLLQKTFECLRMIPELKVSIRFHPVLKKRAETIAQKMVERNGEEKRVEISKPVSLEECIDDSDCVLYISSSAAVKGLYRGAVPVNCGGWSERDLDPLYFGAERVDNRKSTVDSLREIMKIKATRNEELMLQILERYKGLWEGYTPLERDELEEICGL